jgi:hypothetical protein
MPLNKSNENGVIGETRTIALLADDFWILDRLVDTDGADFLIQRKGLVGEKPNFNLSNLAVIQSKYRESENTKIHINENYMYDKTITNTNESLYFSSFYLLLHSGDIDNQEVYLLSSKDLFELWEKDGKKTGKAFQNYVVKKNNEFVFNLKRIKKEPDLVLKDKSKSDIRKGLKKIHYTLNIRDITNRAFSFKIVNSHRGLAPFDNDFEILRNLAIEVGDFILASLRETIETLLVNATDHVAKYTGSRGQLDVLKEIYTNFKNSFENWESEDAKQVKKLKQFLDTYDTFLKKYH